MLRPDSIGDEIREVWRYLGSRQLTAAYELEMFGLLSSHYGDGEPVMPTLPPCSRTWILQKRWIVAPLFAANGELVEVQARSYRADVPQNDRLRFAKGAKAKGTVFASPLGRELLRGTIDAQHVIFGEGMTDSFALSIVASVPVLCAPGTANAAASIGAWAKRRYVLLALDNDAAGEARIQETAKAVVTHGGFPLRTRWPDQLGDACDALGCEGPKALGDWLDELVRLAERKYELA